MSTTLCKGMHTSTFTIVRFCVCSGYGHHLLEYYVSMLKEARIYIYTLDHGSVCKFFL